MNGSRLTIRTSSRTAGAIDSLIWRGKEFLNSYDHGRELQSASSYDGYGEGLNPTEAGSEKDGRGPLSSSLLLNSKAHGRTLETTIQMAYWRTPAGLPDSVRSNDTVAKRVTIGKDGIISYDVTFATAEDHRSATFETLTAYMPTEFSDFLAYDPSKRTAVPLTDGPGEQPLPVILTTPDHQFAMGIYSAGSHPGYGRWRFRDTVKWNAVYRVAPAPKGRYGYHCDVLVGTLDDVRRTLDLLTRSGKGRD